jgi:hypothetical protein
MHPSTFLDTTVPSLRKPKAWSPGTCAKKIRQVSSWLSLAVTSISQDRAKLKEPGLAIVSRLQKREKAQTKPKEKGELAGCTHTHSKTGSGRSNKSKSSGVV